MTIVGDGVVLEVVDHDGFVLVEVAGELTAEEAPPLLDAAGRVIDTSPRNLQLRLQHVTFMDSGGLQALVRVRQRAAAAGVPMQLVGLSRAVRRVLEVTNMVGVFDVVE